MSGIFMKLKDKFIRNNRDNTNNRHADNSHLSITWCSMLSNTVLGNAPTESATFNSIVQNATHTRAVSLSAIPLDTAVGDPDDIIPIRGIYQQHTQIANERWASLPLDMVMTQAVSPQCQYNRLYPRLSPLTPLQGMYTAANQIYTAHRTLYLTSTDGATNQVQQLRTLPQDEHYVSDVATQQDGVPWLVTDTLARPLPPVSNLPNDYDNSSQTTQGVTTGQINPQAQSSTTSLAAVATQNTGETISVPLQEGRHREIVRYTGGSQFHDVAQQLESLLLEYGPNNVTIGNFMYQAELDAFYRDGRDVDFTFAPNVYDSLEFLHRTYYQYKFEVDFPGLHIDCDSGEEEEDLEDTLPYEEPPPPYNEVRSVQHTIGVSSDQGPKQSTLSRPELVSNQFQLWNTNLPQLDGPSESTEQYVSAATFPLHWREYPINLTGTQVLNWDLTGDQLYLCFHDNIYHYFTKTLWNLCPIFDKSLTKI